MDDSDTELPVAHVINTGLGAITVRKIGGQFNNADVELSFKLNEPTVILSRSAAIAMAYLLLDATELEP